MGSTSRKIDAYGRVIVTSAEVFELLYRDVEPSILLVEPDEQIERFNALCQRWDKAHESLQTAGPLALTPPEEEARRVGLWTLPDIAVEPDIRAAMLARCSTPEQTARVEQEMALYEARDLMPVLRLMMALVAHFREHGIVWGVGRGSSVSSYVLFLIGVHKIDSLRYGLDIREFLK